MLQREIITRNSHALIGINKAEGANIDGIKQKDEARNISLYLYTRSVKLF